ETPPYLQFGLWGAIHNRVRYPPILNGGSGGLSAFCRRTFQLQQLLFPLNAPPITGELAVAADHTMARHHHSHRICSTGTRYRPDSPRLSQRLRQLSIRPRFSTRNTPEPLPDPHLKRRRSQIQRQIERGWMVRELRQHLVQRSPQSTIRNNFRSRKLRAQLGHQLI